MAYAIDKIRTFGLVGVCAYAVRFLRSLGYSMRIKFDALLHPIEPEVGVTVVAAFGESNSLNKTMRDLVIMLKRAGIAYQTFDVTGGCRANHDIDCLLTPKRNFRARRYRLVVEMMNGIYPRLRGIENARVVFWEAESGITKAFPFVTDGRIAIAMSDFNYATLKNEIGKKYAQKLLYPFVFDADMSASPSQIRSKYGIKHSAFMVFFNFDYTAFERKNPEAAVRAFSMAFKNDLDAVLVFKTVKGAEFAQRRRRLYQVIRDMGIGGRFVEIDKYIPEKDIYGLTMACDVYLSLHRGEGFGLGIAEAMSIGKPVVVTDYSSTTEFCNADNSCLVPYSLVAMPDVAKNNVPYSWAIEKWADPDVSVAASMLSRLREDSALRTRLGNAAKEFIESRYSISNFKRSALQLLDNDGDAK